jgi:pimeloyl-ACP methyl ester carboxylesterase
MSNGIASSSELRHRQVEVDGIPVHVVEAGSSDKPTLLFLHGWRESSIASSPFAPHRDNISCRADPGNAFTRKRSGLIPLWWYGMC